MNLNTNLTSALSGSRASGRWKALGEALGWVPSALTYGTVYYLAIVTLIK